MPTNSYLPKPARIVSRTQENGTIFTLRLRFVDACDQEAYSFVPGQFNMLYLFGIGEIPISIVSDPHDTDVIDHTIRAVGRVTEGFAKLKPGDVIGIRGPYGRGWPLSRATMKDVIVLTGGLGCAPVVSVIHYVRKRRPQFGRLVVMQGVKHSDDLIWREQYEQWASEDNTQVLLACDTGGETGPWHKGLVTKLIDHAQFDAKNCTVMMCGPDIMMRGGATALVQHNVDEENIWLSTERNMQCGIGLCGHCQMGPYFSCKDGPVFCYHEIRGWLSRKGV